MTAASMGSCRFLARRSPWGRFGSVVIACKRLHRVHRRFKHSEEAKTTMDGRKLEAIDAKASKLSSLSKGVTREKRDVFVRRTRVPQCGRRQKRFLPETRNYLTRDAWLRICYTIF